MKTPQTAISYDTSIHMWIYFLFKNRFLFAELCCDKEWICDTTL